MATSTLAIAEIEKAVVGRFAQIAEVSSIYHDEITFWVFTSDEKYDDSLMDALISQEEAILDLYAGLEIVFQYVPLILCNGPQEIVSHAAHLIFAR
jgi:hypothetical protein